MTINSKIYGLLMALFLGATGLASASNVFTFQVDMSVQIAADTFDPTTNHVYVTGSFDAFSASTLISSGVLLTNNPASSNPALYTGTITNTVDANGAQMAWKFITDSTNFSATTGYETTLPNGNNRLWILGTNTTILLPYTYFSDAGTQNIWLAEFRVDMAMEVFTGRFNTNADTVEVQGDFEGWTSGYTLNWDPTIHTTNSTGVVTSNVYVGNYNLVGSPGEMVHYKFVEEPAAIYEQPNDINGDVSSSGNRFVIIDTNQVPLQVLPLVAFSDVPLSVIETNSIMFQVDMSVMSLLGVLSPTNSSVVSIQGAFNNWTSQTLTNNPAASNTNLYSIVVPNQSAGAGTVVSQFKFLCSPSGNSSYEPGSAFLTYVSSNGYTVSTQGGNRSWVMPQTNNSLVVLPVVYYGDNKVGDALTAPTLVTFSVNMTNAVTGTNATTKVPYAFNPSTDRVYINGVNYPVPTTASTSTQGPNAVAYGSDTTNTAILPFLMTNNPPGSLIYSLQVLAPAGYPVRTSPYRYSINGTNNEGVNNGLSNVIVSAGTTIHQNYIRGLGTYIMPLDTWALKFIDPTSFGNLTAGSTANGTVPIKWTGRHGVNLQVNTSLTNSAGWQDVPNTDATSSANYPAGAVAGYFRLKQPIYFTNY